MKIANKNIEDRIKVTLDKSFRTSETGGIMLYGENNDYPQVVEKIILSSQTGKATRNVYSKFIAGDGFENEEIGSVVVGKDGRGKDITLDIIRSKLAKSLATFNGGYVHANMNIDGIISDTRVVPFKNCRLSKVDDLGNSGKIAVYDNWDSNIDWKKFSKKDVVQYNHFSTNIDVIRDNINKAGGITEFKGQIYSIENDSEYIYPLSPFDVVYLDCDTENQIQLFKNREIRNGFSDKVILMLDDTDDEKEYEENTAKVQNWMGADGDKLILMYTQFDPESGELAKDSSFKIETLETNINDKLFIEWEKSLSNNIRKAAKALPAVLIDYEQGQLSQASGEMIMQAVSYYNSLIRDDRELLEDSLEEIYKNFNSEILRNNTNWKIKPIKLL